MKRNERILTLGLPIVLVQAGLGLLLIHSPAFSQNALDGSLHVGSGGINTTSTPSTRPVRRDSSQTRNFSQGLGLNPYDDFVKLVSSQTGSRPSLGQVQRVNSFGAPPPSSNTNNWKKRDPLQFDSQGLALSVHSSRSMSEEETPYAKYRLNNGEIGIMSASNLRGVKFESERDQVGNGRMSLYETARLREDVRNNTMQSSLIGSRSRDPFQPYQSGDAVIASITRGSRNSGASQSELPLDNRIKGYDAVMQEVKQRFEKRFEQDEKAALASGSSTTSKRALDSNEKLLDAYDRLKLELAEKQPPPPAKASSTGPSAEASIDGQKPPDDASSALDPENAKREGINMTIDEYALVLKHGKRMDSMTGDEKNRLNQLLSEGQRAMYEGNAFVAEKRFQVALSIRPDEPVAIAGMLHCQISANLPGSASLTLHELFTNHPEMMDVKWGAQTIPPRARLEKALEETSRRIALGGDTAKLGLLKAYIGHVLNNPEAVTAGLAELRGTPGDENMAAILRKLWIEGASN